MGTILVVLARLIRLSDQSLKGGPHNKASIYAPLDSLSVSPVSVRCRNSTRHNDPENKAANPLVNSAMPKTPL